MCRMLAVLTTTPAPLPQLIAPERAAFTALSETHRDGWGVAVGQGPTLTVQKSTARALGDPAFESALDEASGDRALLHVRRASEGTELSLGNTHPFVLDGEGQDAEPGQPVAAFSHHGQFPLTPAVRSAFLDAALPRGGRAPGGGTDSELYLALVTAYAHEAGLTADSPLAGWALAVQRAAAETTDLVRRHAHEEPEALNALLLTGRGLVAYQQWDEAKKGKYKAPDTYQLRYLDASAAPTPRVLVASQGWDQSAYADLGQGEALTVEAGSLAVERHAPLTPSLL